MREAIRPLSPYASAPLLVLITAFLMMQPLSTDLYLASLPGLAAFFKAPAATVQLTLSLFVIGFGGAQLVVGPLSDRFGRRPVLLYGLTLYAGASLLCALAQTIDLLIAARFLQALGCSSAAIIARTIVRDAYAPEDSARVIAKASTWLSLTPLLGPIIGSYLQVTFGWRAAFVLHATLSVALIAAVFFRLPETNTCKNSRALKLSGLLDTYRHVLGSREFWAYALPGALSYGSIFAFISGASVVLIRVLQVPTEWFGYCFAFSVSGYMAGTLVCRHLLHRIGPVLALRLGTGITLAAGTLFLAVVLAGYAHWAVVVGAMFLTMCAHGINSPLAQSGSVTPFPLQAGTAAGLAGALYMAVAFVVGTLVGATYNGTLYPLAIISVSMGVLIFGSVRIMIPKFSVKAA